MPDPTTHAALEDEVRQLLGDLGARPLSRELTSTERDRTDRTAAAALDAMLGGGPGAEPPYSPSQQGVPRRCWVLAVAAAVITAAGSVPIFRLLFGRVGVRAVTPAIPRFDQGSRQASRDSTDVLIALAEASARQQEPADLPVQFVATLSWRYAGGHASLASVPAERYLLGNGLIRLIEREPQPLDAEGRVSDDADPRTLPVASDRTIPGPAAGPEYPSTLPTDPARLTAELTSGACSQASACLAEASLSLHTGFVLRPELSAALWRALAATGEADYLGETLDRIGRPAVALQVPAPGADRYRVVYADPHTGALLGADLIGTAHETGQGSIGPAVIGFTAIFGARRVSEDDLP